MDTVDYVIVQMSDLQSIYKETDNIIQRSFIRGHNDEYGWRNKLLFDSQCPPGATATALALWYCVPYGNNINIGNKNIEWYYPKILETIIGMAINVSDEEVAWAHRYDESSTPCIDTTATVVITLSHWEMKNRSTEVNIDAYINKAVTWLIKNTRPESMTWGVNRIDYGRVFVTCKVLDAIIPALGRENESVIGAIKWLMSVRLESSTSCSWGELESSSVGTVFHTAKVLNLLCKYNIKSNCDSDIEPIIELGIKYLKEQIYSGDAARFYTKEEVHEGQNCPTTYYHDGFSELFQLMQLSENKWSLYDVCKIINTFTSNTDPSSFYERDGNRQMWILIPFAKQLHDVQKQVLPPFCERMVVFNTGATLADPSDKMIKHYIKYETKWIRKKLKQFTKLYWRHVLLIVVVLAGCALALYLTSYFLSQSVAITYVGFVLTILSLLIALISLMRKKKDL